MVYGYVSYQFRHGLVGSHVYFIEFVKNLEWVKFWISDHLEEESRVTM